MDLLRTFKHLGFIITFSRYLARFFYCGFPWLTLPVSPFTGSTIQTRSCCEFIYGDQTVVLKFRKISRTIELLQVCLNLSRCRNSLLYIRVILKVIIRTRRSVNLSATIVFIRKLTQHLNGIYKRKKRFVIR